MELSNLKKRKQVAVRGHKMMKDKRDELVRRFIIYARRNKELRDEVERKLALAMQSYVLARASMSSAEIRTAILTGDVNRIKSIKGIGIKTAQRVIIDLKDKIAKSEDATPTTLLLPDSNSSHLQEALSALVMLGFAKAAADKVLKAVYKENPQYTLEELIKFSLKRL